MKRLIDMVEIAENNEHCVILKVNCADPMDLIRLGYFEGDEKMIRITKAENNTYRVWTNNDKSYSWSRRELISDSLMGKMRLVNKCVEELGLDIGPHKTSGGLRFRV